MPRTVRSTKMGSGVHLDGGSLDMKGVGWMVYTDIACCGEGLVACFNCSVIL